MEPTLVTQPVEILHMIGEYLPLGDVKQLRLTCMDFSKKYALTVLKSITIDFKSGQGDAELSKLRRLASGNSPASEIARHLSLRDICPLDLSRENIDPNYDAVKLCIRRNFVKALASLKAIKSLEWKPQSRGQERWVFEEVETFIRTQRDQLVEIHIRDTVTDLVVPFDVLKNLESITLGRWVPPNKGSIFTDFLAAVQNGQLKHLKSIAISKARGMPAPRGDLLGDILRSYPSNYQPLRLSDVSIDHIPVLSSGTSILSHLRYLTSLKLDARDVWRMKEPLAVSDRLWSSLRHSEIRLETLECNIFSRGLVNYLQSYSTTLQNLSLTLPSRDGIFGYRAESEGCQDVLEALTSHSSSLKTLSLVHEAWALTPSNAEILLKLTKLATLTVSVAGAFFNGQRLRTGNLSLITNAALRLERLQVLRLFPADMNDMHKVVPINDALRIFFRRFQSPVSAFVVHLTNCDQTFKPVPDVSGEFWIYEGKELGREFDKTAPTTDDDWPDGLNIDQFFWDELGGDDGSELIYPVTQEAPEVVL